MNGRLNSQSNYKKYISNNWKIGVDHRKLKPKEVLGQQNKVLGKGNSDVSNVHGAYNSQY